MDRQGLEGRRLDRRALERLIAEDGEPADLRERTTAELARVLSAAAAPAGERDLAGEESGVAAFRAALQDEGPAPGGSAFRRAVRRLGVMRSALTALVAAAVLGGGVAFASGNLPLPSSSTPGSPGKRPAATGEVPRGGGGEDRGGGQDSGERRPGAGRSGASDGGAAIPGPPGGEQGGQEGRWQSSAAQVPLTSLCRAYERQPEQRRERSLDTKPFRRLVAEAGGRDRVDGYCARLAAGKGGSDAAPDKPGKTEQPEAEPSADQSGSGEQESTATGSPPPS